MKALFNWLDDRTGYRDMAKEALFESIPGGARWRYVWGSTLVFAFVTQAITGIVLWATYSPSSQTAWESVYYIQHEMWGGWFVRGLHHFMAQAMIVLLVIHLVQIIIDGAYRAPREINFWIGLILAKLVIFMSLTGYLLPWDQKGYWATKVATNIAGATPVVGADVQQFIVGGSDYGHHTLTRFFMLHAGLIPAMIIFFIVLHIMAFRRHGLHAKVPLKKATAYFWPDQIMRDSVACLAVLAAVVGLTIWAGFSNGWGDPTHLGAPLSAPADPSQEFSAARPEWYFLSLFQLLKLVPLLVGAFFIPGIAGALFAAMPVVGKAKIGHYFNIVVLVATMIGAVALTVMALQKDGSNYGYQRAVAEADVEAHRVIELAKGLGIPREGAVTLLQNDPKTRGAKLFVQHCGSCHGHGDDDRPLEILNLDPAATEALHANKLATIGDVKAANLSDVAGLGDAHKQALATALDKATLSGANLKGFHTSQWLTDFFDPEQIATDKFFGKTSFSKKSAMIKYIKGDVPEYAEDEKKMLAKLIINFGQIANRNLPRELEPLTAATKIEYKQQDEKKKLAAEANLKLVSDTAQLIGDFGLACTDCHKFYGEGSSKGPDLSSYRSRNWIIALLQDPANVGYKPKSYPDDEDKDAAAKAAYIQKGFNMPAFGASGQLDAKSIELITDYLMETWYEAPKTN
jgi:ubiquinol-cytochrome c reductase cytochrome b subunit